MHRQSWLPSLGYCVHERRCIPEAPARAACIVSPTSKRIHRQSWHPSLGWCVHERRCRPACASACASFNS
eukprot:1158363-Pelagomonas_calceolata.AAC.2